MNIENNYAALRQVLDAAFQQASAGKGAERHGNAGDIPFTEHPMQVISQLLDSDDGLAYQAIKKIREARGFPEFERQERELLGAINYIAGMIIFRRRIDQMAKPDADFDNAAKQFESLTGCTTYLYASQRAKYFRSLLFTMDVMPADMVAKFRENAERHYFSDQNPLNLVPQQATIDAHVIMMVNKMQNAMVTLPEADYAGDIAVIVNPGEYWETGNQHPDLYARRFVEVVKSQAMLHPHKTVLAKLSGYHNGYLLDLIAQRDYILDLLCRGGMYQVESNGTSKHEFRVVYNH